MRRLLSALRVRGAGRSADLDAGSDPRSTRLSDWLLQDWRANYRLECQIILAWFRLVQWVRARSTPLGWIVGAPYRLVVTLLIGVDLSPQTSVGPGLRLIHPQGIVIHRDASLGANVTILHGVTVGNANDRAGGRGGVPTIGDWVELGAGCVVLGDIELGERARIGANAVVTRSVEPWGVAVGIPAVTVRVDRETSLEP